MIAQTDFPKADLAPATTRRPVQPRRIQAPARWMCGLFALFATLALSASSAFAQTYQWTNFVGMPGGAGSTEGAGSAARFSSPSSVAVDASGNVYVSDSGNETIRKVTPGGVVSTLAGQVNVAGGNDGPGSTASFNRPAGLAVDSSGNLYVADYASNTLRMVTPSGVVSTLAGIQGLSGHSDGPASSATFNGPNGMAVDASGYVYITDTNNNKLRRLAPDGTVATYVASPSYLAAPAGVAVDGSGNIYVADQSNHCIRIVTPAGAISTLAGQAGSSGSNDGTVSTARFYRPGGVAVDASGNVYVADTGNSTLRKVTPGGVVSTVAGLALSKGSSDGTGSAALFNAPGGLAVDGSGNLYVADAGNHTLRKVTPGGVVTTLAGQASSPGTTDGTGSTARFLRPWGAAADGSGNVYIADSGNNTLRKTTSAAVVSTLAGLAGSTGTTDGTGSAARFNGAPGVAVDGSGNVYIADKGSHTIRKVTSGGVVSTLAGLGLSSGSTDGTGSAARFRNPSGVAVDGSGNLYVADLVNHTIRKVTSGGVVTTLAGLAGSSGSSDGTGSTARFYFPTGVAVDASGNVYVADQFNNTLRMVTSGGVVTTLAGLAGSSGSSDGTGSAARFNAPTGVAVDVSGNVYVADSGNSTLRMVTPAGVVTTIGGTAGTIGGTDGIGAAASFSQAQGIAVSSSGTLYVADTGNNRISMGTIVPAPVPVTTPASSITTTAATLNGTVNANGFSTAVSFDYGLTTAYGSTVAGTPTPVTGGSATSVSAVLSGLSPGTTYHFRVNGTSSGGTASGSDMTFTTNALPATVTTQAATAITAFGATLNGTVNANGFSTIASFEYGVTTAYGVKLTFTGTPVTGSSDTAFNFAVNGLSPGTTYHFRINGSNSGGLANGSDLTFTTSAAPATVTTLAATSVTESGATLNGTVNANGSNTAVSFDYGPTIAYGTTVAGTPTPVTGGSATAVSAVITGLNPGTTYHFRVNGTNSGGTANGGDQTFTFAAPPGPFSWSNFVGMPGGFGNADGTGSAARFVGPGSVALDSSGNVYVADSGNHTIRKMTPAGVVTTLAGLAGNSGSSDGTGSAARFNNPFGVAVDGSGNVYVADSWNHTIRKVTPAGMVTTLAGLVGNGGSSDGTGSSAQFNYPLGLAVDGSGNVYVADSSNNAIRKVTPAGVVSTLAGGFYNPGGVAVDGSGNVFVADSYNHTIRKVTPGGVVTTLAGLVGVPGSGDGTGGVARFNNPEGVAVDGSGNVYVADSSNHTLRMVTPGGVVTTLAGLAGNTGSSDGTGSAARFYTPSSVASDGSGNLYVADTSNNTVRKVAPGGVVTTLAGLAGSSGSSDGTGNAARFVFPQGVTVDSSGNLYVADYYNFTLRKVTPTGVVSTLAGLAGSSGSTDGTGSAARFYGPSGVAVDGSGNVYVADNNTIRKVTPGGVVTTLAGQAGSIGRTDGTGSAARFSGPSGVAVDGSGNVYVADSFNQAIRKVTPGGVVSTVASFFFVSPKAVAVDGSGNIYVADAGNHTLSKVAPGGAIITLAGLAGGPGSSDGTGSAARFNYPTGLALDGNGILYVADHNNNTIRMVTPAGVVTTLGGTAGVASGADGIVAAARFSGPAAIAVSSTGTLFVADSGNNRISMGVVVPAPIPVASAAGSITESGATLNGTVNANGFSTDVSFDYGLTTAYGTHVAGTPTTVTGSSATAVSAVISGLSPGTTYHFRVNGTSSQGTNTGSDLTFTTNGPPVTVTTAANTLNNTGATLNGTVNAFGLSTTVSFDYGLTTDYGTNVAATPTPVTGGSDTAVSAVLTGLSPGTTYHFRVNGTNSLGTTHGSDLTFTTSALPPTAQTLFTTSITSAGATLIGFVNAFGLSTAVSFEYGLTTAYGSTVAGTPTPLTGNGFTGVDAVLTGLSPGTTYHFRVNGTSSLGTTHGNDQTFTTSASTPTSWRQQWFSTTSNTGTAADNADPFHIGVPNLVAYALFGPNQNPAQVSAAQLPQPQRSGGNFGFSFTEPAGVSGITYGAEYTPSLSPANWQPVTDTGTGTLHIFSVPIGSTPRMFMRLTLTNLNP